MRSSTLYTSLSYTVRTTVNGEPLSRVYNLSNVLANKLDRGDVVTSAVSDGFRPPLPYHAEGSQLGYGFVDLKATYSVNGRSYVSSALGTSAKLTYGLVSGPQVQKLISDGDVSRLIIKLLNDVGNQKWSAGQMIAESQGAIDLIGDSARKLARAATFASQRRWNLVAKELGVKPIKLGKAAKNPASGWLAYHFGWVPVVDDVVNSALYLGGHLDRDALIIMARGRLDETLVLPRAFSSDFGVSTNGTTGGSDINYGQYYEDTHRFSDQYKASLYYKIDDSFLRDMSKFGLIGASTPWAIMPWSFLLDWIVPIGDYLAAMDATVGLKYLGGSYTRFQRSTCERKSLSLYGFPRSPKVSGAVTWTPGTRFIMDRVVWDKSPLPFPAYIKNPLDPWKAVTSIALMAQVKIK